MLVSEEARVFQVRGLRCSKEPTVVGLSPVRLGNRTYRAWMTTKLTPMVWLGNRTIGVNLGFPWYRRLGRTELRWRMSVFQTHIKSDMLPHTLKNPVKPNFTPSYPGILHNERVGFHSVSG